MRKTTGPFWTGTQSKNGSSSVHATATGYSQRSGLLSASSQMARFTSSSTVSWFSTCLVLSNMSQNITRALTFSMKSTSLTPMTPSTKTASACSSMDKLSSSADCHLEDVYGENIVFACNKCPPTSPDVDQRIGFLCVLVSTSPRSPIWKERIQAASIVYQSVPLFLSDWSLHCLQRFQLRRHQRTASRHQRNPVSPL